MKRFLAVIMLLCMILCGCSSGYQKGNVFLREGKFEEAKAFFQTLIDEKKDLEQAYYGMGISCFELKEYEEAATCLELALAHKTANTAETYSMLGACNIELQQYDKALENYQKVLEDEKLTDALKQEAEYNLIAVYEYMGDWAAAKKQLDEYKSQYPDDIRLEKESIFLETR